MLRCCARLVGSAPGANSAAAFRCLGISRDNSFARAALGTLLLYHQYYRPIRRADFNESREVKRTATDERAQARRSACVYPGLFPDRLNAG